MIDLELAQKLRAFGAQAMHDRISRRAELAKKVDARGATLTGAQLHALAEERAEDMPFSPAWHRARMR